jgi:hypothetical protein
MAKAETLQEGQIKINVMDYGRNLSRPRATVRASQIFPADQEEAGREWAQNLITRRQMRRAWVVVKHATPVIKTESQLGRLVALLTEQTQEQKAEYILRTGEWAAAEFDRMQAWVPKAQTLRAEVEKEYSALRGAERQQYRHGLLGRPYHSEEWYAHGRRMDAAKLVLAGGSEKFVADAKAHAEAHYTASIDKLALRVEAKGLNLDALTVTRAQVKQNLETRLTDGQQTVRAFTILAWGPIVRPHYRYLIK